LLLAFFVAAMIAPVPAQGSGTAVVAIHGGGWWGGTPANVKPICDALPGVRCFRPTYPLSGSGPYPAANQDLQRFIRDRVRGELGYERVIAFGVSAGANLAAWLVAEGDADACVGWSGPFDLRSWRTSPTWVLDQFAPNPEAKAAASTLSLSQPCLLVHSRGDRTVPLSQSVGLHAAAPFSLLVTLNGTCHGMQCFSSAMNLSRTWVRARL
jgi:acetyl esterase/lipase